MVDNIQPIVPEGTPLPPAPVGVPPFPITPFAVWTWNTPVIPEFYWNIYSAEQRIKSICKEIGKIEAYLNYLTNKTNENIIELHKRIDQLTERVAALEKKVEEEVARLDALIAQLRSDLEQEIADRQEADEALGERIDQEIVDRTHGDDALHQEISQETQDRIHADDQLHQEISQETQNREDADSALETRLTAAIAQRLLPTDITAGDEITVTRPDPNSNRIVIASTVAHSISELETEISGLQAALEAEVSERRADDAKLWVAVNNRIERGKILAGPGIKVKNDPDSSTVTISATGGGTGGSTEITGTAPITVTDGEAGEKIVGVSAATEDAAGVITESRVKELAPDVQAGTGIKVATDGSATTVSLATPYPTVTGTVPVTVDATSSTTPGAPGTGTTYRVGVSAATESAAGIITESRVKELAGSGITINGSNPINVVEKTPGTYNLGLRTEEPLALDDYGNLKINSATSSKAGIITEARVKELASSVAPSLSAEAPLKLEDGTMSLTKDPNGPVTSSSAGLSVREVTPETSSDSEAGVVSKKTIKSLAKVSVSGGAATNGGLKEYPSGGLGVNLTGNWLNPIGVGPNGELTLTSGGDIYMLNNNTKEIALNNAFFSPTSDGYLLTDLNTPNNTGKAEFALTSGYFEVKNTSGAWKTARSDTFKLVAEPDQVSTRGDNKGFPIYHRLWVLLTPRGQAIYTNQDPGDSGKTQITTLRVTYGAYVLYILPE